LIGLIYRHADEYHSRDAFEARPRTKETAGAFSFLDEKETTSEYWLTKGQSILSDLINRKDNTNRAKNVIMFLGDGMSFPTVAATRVYMKAEETQLSFEKFPHSGFSKVSDDDLVVVDRAFQEFQ
jgi:alkaline phosphatase